LFDFFSLFALAYAMQPVSTDSADQHELEVVMWIAARPESCNLALATRISLQSLINEPEWKGKCVAVDGYWRERALFADASDARRKSSQWSGELRARRVGIYGTPKLLKSAPQTGVAYTAIGIAGQCDTLTEGAIMVMGYCHHTGGPYIAVSEMRRR
jgi:hypothetical protein